MTMKEAMHTRHMVRSYTNSPIPQTLVSQLQARIVRNNATYQLAMKLVTERTDAFQAVIKLVLAKGVRNYIILAGQDSAGLEERLGYCGADLMLYAQTLGLNTWWVGGTFRRKGVQKHISGDQKIAGIIAVGYGTTQGVPHKSKKPEDISTYRGVAPEWFKDGVDAVLLAPTALNKQAFSITGDGSLVSMACHNGIFSDIDLGIGKYHFELGAGTEHFHWDNL